ncbi:CutC-like protein [Granulosicoccus antarcticus IMCC3135]|uniref:PF03932 family protein CutC n=1 Tax=Granulosicoccus antarcticus IMCC3135 TaxID=1192854 RepID=A0A2Z2NWQ4_9GAMM|nr:CutC-like protein [Granulosicoccus antarcticus IMCC3135]
MDSEQALSVCEKAGVERIELCAALALGGLTPSHGFMQRAAQANSHKMLSGSDGQAAQVYAMVRPRAGDFCFSKAEVDIMCVDIKAAGEAGLAGVVLGAATTAGALDQACLERLCEAAGSMGKTLHRVIDMLDDPLQAIDQAVALGFERILTSGGARQVGEGLVQLGQMQAYAGNRICIMAGAGLSPTLAGQIRSQTGIGSFHSSCTRVSGEESDYEAFGFAQGRGLVDEQLIREYQRILAIC